MRVHQSFDYILDINDDGVINDKAYDFDAVQLLNLI